jgi:perosamine synthetase
VIPVFQPEINKKDIKFVVDALRKGEISGNFGDYLESFEQNFASYCGSRYGVAVSNGTTALQLAIKVLDLEPGSEVLISSTTNIATALAVIHNNLIPVTVDSELSTWNLDIDLIEPLITEKTKAIIPVHIYGHPVNMERLSIIANKYNLKVIEDCAESHGATMNGKVTGSFGLMGCFSFYANKIITTGEGGMVITDNKELSEKLKLYRNLGFGEPRFVHKVAGFNFRMSGYQAALGLSQLSRIEKIIDKKRRIAHRYNKNFSHNNLVRGPVEKDWAKNVYWMYAIVLSNEAGITRDSLVHKLHQEGIETRTFFCPMDQQPALQGRVKQKTLDANSDYLWRQGLYLPSSHNLTDKEIDKISGLINNFLL